MCTLTEKGCHHLQKVFMTIFLFFIWPHIGLSIFLHWNFKKHHFHIFFFYCKKIFQSKHGHFIPLCTMAEDLETV